MKIFGKIAFLIIGIVSIIGRCASRGGDELLKLGRGADNIPIHASDDLLRYSDDAVRYGDDFIRKSDVATNKALEDIFLKVGEHGGEYLLDEVLETEQQQQQEQEEIENLLSDYPHLNGLKLIYYGKGRQKKYNFTLATKKGFLAALARSTPIDKPKEWTNVPAVLRKSYSHSYWVKFGKDWIGIRGFKEKKFHYYTLDVDLTKVFK